MPGLSQRSPARILCAVLLLSARGFGDHVVPSDDVTSGVIVRVNPATESAIVGTLRPGEQAELLGSVPRWYQV
jgi:hypothetical protein